MVSLSALWLPVVVAAVLVFVASTLIHVLLGYHQSDFGPLPDEDRVVDALEQSGVEPGEYILPHAGDREAMASEEHQEKMRSGHMAIITVMGPGPPAMGKRFAAWFAYCLVVGLFAAYVTSRALGPGAEYMSVFRFTGTTAFMGYALALAQDSIWYGRAWSTTFKNALDGLVYALLTAGAFGWLWPG